MWMAGFKEERASYEELSWWRVGSFKLKKKTQQQAPTKIKKIIINRKATAVELEGGHHGASPP